MQNKDAAIKTLYEGVIVLLDKHEVITNTIFKINSTLLKMYACVFRIALLLICHKSLQNPYQLIASFLVMIYLIM